MDTTSVLTLAQESIFTLTTFGVCLVYTMWKGRYALINIIFALYLALLISLKFPYYDTLLHTSSGDTAFAKISIFVIFVIIGTFLFRRHIPGDDYEPAFQHFGKKIILAVSATILIMIFSFHALPVTEIVHTSTPIQALFAPQAHFFWWLILPIIVLFFT